MSYTPPSGDSADLVFGGVYTPPAGNAADLILSEVAPGTTLHIFALGLAPGGIGTAFVSHRVRSLSPDGVGAFVSGTATAYNRTTVLTIGGGVQTLYGTATVQLKHRTITAAGSVFMAPGAPTVFNRNRTISDVTAGPVTRFAQPAVSNKRQYVTMRGHDSAKVLTGQLGGLHEYLAGEDGTMYQRPSTARSLRPGVNINPAALLPGLWKVGGELFLDRPTTSAARNGGYLAVSYMAGGGDAILEIYDADFRLVFKVDANSSFSGSSLDLVYDPLVWLSDGSVTTLARRGSFGRRPRIWPAGSGFAFTYGDYFFTAGAILWQPGDFYTELTGFVASSGVAGGYIADGFDSFVRVRTLNPSTGAIAALWSDTSASRVPYMNSAVFTSPCPVPAIDALFVFCIRGSASGLYRYKLSTGAIEAYRPLDSFLAGSSFNLCPTVAATDARVFVSVGDGSFGEGNGIYFILAPDLSTVAVMNSPVAEGGRGDYFATLDDSVIFGNRTVSETVLADLYNAAIGTLDPSSIVDTVRSFDAATGRLNRRLKYVARATEVWNGAASVRPRSEESLQPGRPKVFNSRQYIRNAGELTPPRVPNPTVWARIRTVAMGGAHSDTYGVPDVTNKIRYLKPANFNALRLGFPTVVDRLAPPLVPPTTTFGVPGIDSWSPGQITVLPWRITPPGLNSAQFGAAFIRDNVIAPPSIFTNDVGRFGVPSIPSVQYVHQVQGFDGAFDNQVPRPQLSPFALRISEDINGVVVYSQAAFGPPPLGLPDVSYRHRGVFTRGAADYQFGNPPRVEHRVRKVAPKGINSFTELNLMAVYGGDLTVHPYWGRLTEEEFPGGNFETAEFGQASARNHRPELLVQGLDATQFGQAFIETFNRAIYMQGLYSARMPEGTRVHPPFRPTPPGVDSAVYGEATVWFKVRQLMPAGVNPPTIWPAADGRVYTRATPAMKGLDALSFGATQLRLSQNGTIAGIGDTSVFGRPRVGACAC